MSIVSYNKDLGKEYSYVFFKTGVVITTHDYNGIYVRQCLECYIRELPKNYFIVLFINESSDDITLSLQKTYADNNNINIIIIENQTEFGGLTGTWNKGIDLCLENNCDIIILSNDDILFDNSIINIIWDCHKQKNEMKYFGPITNNPGPAKNNLIQYGTHPVNTKNKICLFNNETCNLNGFFMVFSKINLIKNKFNKKHYFNPERPFGGNEIEWFNRFKKLGGIPIIVSKTFIYHYKLAKWRNKKQNNVCIYTVNTGSYEGNRIYLKKSDIDTLYFTDNFDTIYKCINLKLKPFYVDSKDKETKLLQRIIKTNPCDFLPHHYKRSVYIDGNIKIKNYRILKHHIKRHNFDIICFKHSRRTTIKDEAIIVLRQNLEIKSNIDKVISEFKDNNFLDNIGLTVTNVLIRSHRKIQEFNKDWCRCINICRRDQISFDFLLYKHKIKYHRLETFIKNRLSIHHVHINPYKRKMG